MSISNTQQKLSFFEIFNLQDYTLDNTRITQNNTKQNFCVYLHKKLAMDDRNMHNLLIDIKNLTWGYPETPSMLFHKFNFALYKNDFCVVMGKSGVGKSTLLKFLIGQMQIPLRTIYHKREDMSRYSDNEIQMYRRKIGTIFQDYKLMEDLTVRENIIYPLKLYEL